MLHDVGHGLATLSLLAAAANDPEGRERILGLLDAEATRLLAVVRDGLRGVVVDEPVALRALLEEIVAVTACVSSTSIVLEPGPEVVVRADPTMVWRAVSNIVDNAVRAAGPAGRVQLDVAGGRRGGAVIDIVDDGPGFPDGPLRAGHLGLPLAVRMLAECGGRLEIDEGHPCGTQIRILLPGSAEG
ncbi:MAG TPA: HAMP domain-containing sensor histidine kinase [Pseudonocardia sp.]